MPDDFPMKIFPTAKKSFIAPIPPHKQFCLTIPKTTHSNSILTSRTFSHTKSKAQTHTHTQIFSGQMKMKMRR